MVKKNDDINILVSKFLFSLEEKNIKIDKAFLFGSYAKGNATIDSDIDIAIVSDDFIGDRVDDRQSMSKLIWEIDTRIEPVPYRLEDFNEIDPLVYEIVHYGIRII